MGTGGWTWLFHRTGSPRLAAPGKASSTSFGARLWPPRKPSTSPLKRASRESLERPMTFRCFVSLRPGIPLQHRLCDTVSHRGDTERPLPSIRFRYLDHPDGCRKVSARRHPIPDLVEVRFEPPLELGNRFFVDTCSALVRLDTEPGFPDHSLGNTERFRFTRIPERNAFDPSITNRYRLVGSTPRSTSPSSSRRTTSPFSLAPGPAPCATI